MAVTENTTGNIAAVVVPKSPPWLYLWSISANGSITSSMEGTSITFAVGSVAGGDVTLSVIEINPAGTQSSPSTATVNIVATPLGQ